MLGENFHKVVDIEAISRRPHTLNKKHYIRNFELHQQGEKFEVNKSIPIDVSLMINFVALLWTSSIAFTSTSRYGCQISER